MSHAFRLARGRIPAQLIVQLTDSCNATCPQCGMRRNTPFRRSLLSLGDCRRIIDHAANSGVAALSFTGGEPFLHSKNLLTLIHYAGDAGIPYIRTGTNGFLFMNSDNPDFTARISRIAESLAATKLYTFWISIDSPDPELHESMRGLPGVIQGIERALPIFHQHGIFPSANLGITKAILPKRAAAKASAPVTTGEFREGFRAFFTRVCGSGIHHCQRLLSHEHGTVYLIIPCRRIRGNSRGRPGPVHRCRKMHHVPRTQGDYSRVPFAAADFFPTQLPPCP